MDKPGVPSAEAKQRLWRYAGQGIDFWPIWEWPPHMRKFFLLGQSRDNDQRYELFTFWVMNGMPPVVAGEWLRLEDSAPGVKVFTERKKVLIHVRQMIGQYEADKLIQPGGKRMVDMITRKVTVFTNSSEK